MYTDITWKINHQSSIFLDPTLDFIFRTPFSLMHQFINFFLRQTKYLSQFPHDSPALKSIVHAQQRNILATIPHEQVLKDGVAIFPTKVNIKVGRRGPIGDQEPFKKEVKRDGIRIGNA